MNVLISAYTGLGNFILKTPMIKKIRELYPEAKIDIIAGNRFGTEFVLKDSHIINDILILKDNSSFIQKVLFFLALRKKEYDVIFLPFDAQPLFLIIGSYLAGIKKRVMHFIIKKKLRTLATFFFTIYYSIASFTREA